MRTFSGFPPGEMRDAAIPERTFTEIIPLIDDLAELKVTLHVLWRLGQRRGKVRYLRRADLEADQVLLSGLGDMPLETLSRALARAVERATLLRVETTTDGQTEELYFANTPEGRAAIKAISRGQWPDELEPAERPNIFALYEQNIGMLTPLVTDELRAAEQEYPPEWIEDAFREAILHNKRNWKYVRAILKRWRDEGREDEADRRRYIQGKYGKYIQH